MRCSLVRPYVITRNIGIVVTVILFMTIYRGEKYDKANLAANISPNSLKYTSYKDRMDHGIDPYEVRRLTKKYNSAEEIRNLDIFGPIKSSTTIIVVQVQERVEYLKYLLMSLSQMKGVEDVLLILSHSYYDQNMNNMVRGIDFCRVMQLFFPYSIQAYPREFPGYEAHDSPHKSKSSTGARIPDNRGHYRQPEVAQRKHHWWWTANKIFENLTCTENYEGLVMFLDDDVYVLEDFLYMTLLMKTVTESFPRCDFISLGKEELPTLPASKHQDTHRVEINDFNPDDHSVALAFDLSTWNIVVTQYDMFCRIDDYSWSHALYHIALYHRDINEFNAISSFIPRAYKIRTYLYDNFFQHNFLSSVYKILSLQFSIQNNMFPPQLEVYIQIKLDGQLFNMVDVSQSNGGWGDPRDRELCGNMTVSKIKKVIYDMEYM